MKEREVTLNTAQSELTRQPVNSTLKLGGIFMPNEGGEVPKAPEQVVKESGETLTAQQAELLTGLYKRSKLVDVRRALKGLLEKRIIPPRTASALGPSDNLPPDQDQDLSRSASVPPPTEVQDARQDTGKEKKKKGKKQRRSEAMLPIDEGRQELVDQFLRSKVARATKGIAPEIRYTYIVDDPYDPEFGQEKEHVTPTEWLSASRSVRAGEQDTVENRTRNLQSGIKDARDKLGEHISMVLTSDNYDEIREAADGFIIDVKNVYDVISKTEKEILDLARKMGILERHAKEPKDGLNTMDAGEKRERMIALKAVVKEMAPYIRAHYQDLAERKESMDMPRSLEDLVSLARDREEREFMAGGTKDLIEEVTVVDEDGTERTEERVNLANFYEWVRHQMWKVHDFNSTSEVNFFADEGMGIKTTFRTINFFEIIFTPSFFRQKRKEWAHIVDPKTGTVKRQLREGSQYNEDYSKLRDALLYEVYIFQLMRNGDWVYRDNMSGVKGMTQALQGIFKINPLTRDDYMERILTMPAMTRRSLGEKGAVGKTIQEKLATNFIMGDAVRSIWDVYNYIWDYDSVAKLLGTDSVFFQREYDEFDDKGKTGERLHGGGKFIGGEYNPDWFDANGIFKGKALSSRERKKFMSYMNLFMGPSRNQTQLKEIRHRIILSIADKYGISLDEAKMAEAWAYSLCRFTGLAARNDTESVGFDQWTKQGNLEKYRQRQKSERRRAKRGSKYTMEDKKTGRPKGLKRITLTFIEATRDTNGRAIYEIMQGGQGSHIDLENNPIKKDVDFEREYQKDAQGNYVFVTYNGRVLSDAELDKFGLLGTNRVVVIDGKVKFKKVTYDQNGRETGSVDVEPHTHGLRPIKGAIVFKDAQGAEIHNLRGRAVSYELDKNGNPTFYNKQKGEKDRRVVGEYDPTRKSMVFYDDDGNLVDYGNVPKPNVVEREVQKIEFDYDVMRQFMANVIEMSSEWYEFVINFQEFGFLDIIKGINSAGRPIIDEEKLNPVRDKIRKNLTYSLSTWPGTDYTKKIRTWEALEEGEVGYDPHNPEANHEMSILRSMFGDEVLAFIQLEVRSKTRHEDAMKNAGAPISHIDVWHLERYHDILSDEQKRELKIAIWTGVITYMVAKEVENHRALDTNAKRWNHDEMRNVVHVLHDSGILNEEEVPMMQEHTGTQPGRMFGQAFLSAMSTGNLEGFWEMIKAIAKQSLI